jgi:F-type H+-transporting ATPase subunit epsilon
LFILSVISPEGLLINERETESLIIETKTGELNILPGHLDIISILGDGIMKVDSEAPSVLYGGVMEVEGDKVMVLADKIRLASKIDIIENQNRLNEIDKILKEETLSDLDFKQLIKEKGDLEVELRIFREGR